MMLFRCGELAKEAGVSKRTIHYYVQIGLLPPPDGKSAAARYNTEHLERLQYILRLKKLHLPLSKIRERLERVDLKATIELGGHLDCRTLLENIPYGVAVVQDGMLVYANQWAIRLTGHNVEIIKTGEYHALWKLLTGRAPREEVADLSGLDRAVSFKETIRDRNGNDIHLEIHVRKIMFEGAPAHQFSFSEVRDIQPRIRAGRLQLIADTVQQAVWMRDYSSGRFLFVNGSFERMFGVSFDSLQKDPDAWLQRIVQEDRRKLHEENACWSDGGVSETEVRIQGEEGVPRWVHCVVYPIRKERHGIDYLVGVIEDITVRKVDGDRIRASEHVKRQVLNGMNELFAFYREPYLIDWSNRAAAESVGLPQDDIPGKLCYQLWQKRDTPCPKCPVKRVFLSRKMERIEMSTPSGHYYRITAYPVFGDDGALLGVTEQAEDVTLHMLAEEARRQSDIRFRNLVRNLPDGIVIVFDRELHPLEVGGGVLERAGYDSVSSDQKGDLLPQSVIMALNRFGPRTINGEYCSFSLEFNTRVFDARTLPIYDDGKEISSGMLVAHDVTERIVSEERQRRESRRMLSVFESLPAFVYLQNPDYSIQYANKRFKELFGESENRKCFEVFHGYRAPCERCKTFRIFRENRPQVREWRVQGKKEVFLLHEIPFREADGILRVLVLGMDITKQKETEKALRNSQELLSGILNTSPIAIGTGLAIRDDNGQLQDIRVHYTNPSLQRLIGLGQSGILGKPATELFGETLDNTLLTNLLNVIRTGMPFSDTIQYYYNDTYRWGNLTVVKYQDGILLMIEDITARINAEKDLSDQRAALARSEEQYHTTLDHMGDLIHVIDRDYRIILVNRAYLSWLERFGMDTEVMDKTLFDLFPFLGNEVKEQYERVLQTGEALRTREKNTFQDKTIHTETRKIPVLDAGKVQRVITVIRDITETVRAEERIKQSLEEKEILLREIHHRVKNNLQIIVSLLNLQARSVNHPLVESKLQESRNRVRAISMIHEKLYQSQNLAEIRMEDYTRTLVGYLREIYREKADRVRFDVNISDCVLTIQQAIPCALVIHEIVSNAFKYAFPENSKGMVHIHFHPDGSFWCLNIWDDGSGLPENLDVEKTSTLGLQLVKMLCHQMNGEYRIDSDQGVRFEMKFPLKEPVQK